MYLEVGETLEHPIAWELYALPAGLQTPDERRQAVVDWLADR